ncbi:MAG: FAD:protein FMN transferase [Agathobacter sp.]|nr:FAD:protein FMN transferase [Agathobacter sp.]
MSKIKKYIPALFAILFVVLGIGLPIIKNKLNPPPEIYTATYLDVFDTVTQFKGYANSEEEFKECADILKAELETYHELYNIYSTYEGVNNLKIININAGIQPVKVDQKIIDLLKFSIDLYDKTDGQINIAMGSVLSIWHNYRNAGISDPTTASLPPMEDLEEAAKHTDINNIIIDEEASTVYLADPEMSLDVGSIGKGFAVQKVTEYAIELGYNNLIINAGGNAFAIGTHPDGSKWKVGLQNPDLNAPDPVLTSILFADQCLVTSGDYQRFYTVDDVEYCHIIDPDTLMPAEHFKSVSILTNDSGLADALSTAVFCMSYEEGLALIDSLENTEALWVFEDGSIHYSENFEDYIVE